MRTVNIEHIITLAEAESPSEAVREEGINIKASY